MLSVTKLKSNYFIRKAISFNITTNYQTLTRNKLEKLPSSYRRILYIHLLHGYASLVVSFLLGNSPVSELIQTPVNYPEERIQHSEHGESLKSSMQVLLY